jgi:hypothetical protein
MEDRGWLEDSRGLIWRVRGANKIHLSWGAREKPLLL